MSFAFLENGDICETISLANGATQKKYFIKNALATRVLTAGEPVLGDNGVETGEFTETIYEEYCPHLEVLNSGVEVSEHDPDGSKTREADRLEKKRSDAKLKIEGVEFAGVMCSATKDDQFGLGSILPLVQQGYEFNFHFENGNKLKINPDNVVAFMTVWVPFRESFF